MRFPPDGSVTDIGDRPADVSAQDRLNRLLTLERNGYRTLVAGRAVFQIGRAHVDELKTAAEHKQPEDT